MNKDLELAIKVLTSANELLLKRFKGSFEIESKAGYEIVTSVDKELEAFITSELRRESRYSILGEESGLNLVKDSEYTWVLDPIDGTTNFSRGIPIYGISLALMKGEELYLGVISNPNEGIVYYAEKGKGAFKGSERLKLDFDLKRAPIIFLNNGYGDDAHERCKEQTRRISNRFSKRSLGTTVIELAYLIDGRVDAFLCSGDKLWDFAAALLIAEEAGLSVSCWDGSPWKYGRDDIIVCRPDLKDELVGISSDLI
jgi:myo-inositol-1(or 4)-monophosphatase